MKSVAIRSAVITLVATETIALSCLRPDVADSFERAAQAEAAYVIMLGTFSFGAVPPSRTENINIPREVSVRSEFKGEYLTSNGFQSAPPLAVDIAFDCVASWCGQMASDGAQVLAFVLQTDAGYTLNVGPCGGQAFREPSSAQIEQVLSCMNGDSCEPLRN